MRYFLASGDRGEQDGGVTAGVGRPRTQREWL